jgi:hypothetical protein
MPFKLVEGAQKNCRGIDGHNQLPKLIQGVRFTDGIEVIGNFCRASSPCRRLILQAVTKIRRLARKPLSTAHATDGILYKSISNPIRKICVKA